MKFSPVIRCLSVLMLLGLAACASGATAQKMSVQQEAGFKPNPAFKNAIAVNNVSGGSDTNPMWKSMVGSAEFKTALIESLRNMGYLAPEGSKAKYTLDASLTSLDQPIIGFTFDVESSVSYQVSGAQSKNYPIVALGSASVSDAFLGVERLRIANENSIKNNIKKFLEEFTGVKK